MSKLLRVPSYRLHKQSGQAIVTLPDGLGSRRDVLLGVHGSPESRAEYARVLAEWEANNRCLAQVVAKSGLSVNELILAYWRHAEVYYRKNGEPTSQRKRIRSALRALKELYGHTAARDFDPLSLQAVRERMVQTGWARGYVNSCVGCFKRVFRWGVQNELLPSSVYHGLLAVEGLKKGRTEARETQRVKPVPSEHVEAVLPFLTRPVRAMVQVQRLAGMRPCEVVIRRPCDSDPAHGKTWLYRPSTYKTEHHDIERVIFLGPQAQEVLKPFLDRPPDAFLFSPREAIQEFRARQRRDRRSKVQPSQIDRRKRKPKKQPRERYSVCTYGDSIERACDRAGVPRWAPNRLRHSAATQIRKEHGLDAARAVVGHRTTEVTEVYAELDTDKAAEVMARLG